MTTGSLPWGPLKPVIAGSWNPPSPGFWETETVRGLTVRFTALAVLIVVSLSVAIGCSGNRDYDEEVRDAFLTNCEYAGSTPSVGIGTLECSEERLTQSDFEYEENIILLTGELSERMVEVTARCLKREYGPNAGIAQPKGEYLVHASK